MSEGPNVEGGEVSALDLGADEGPEADLGDAARSSSSLGATEQTYEQT